MVDVFGFGWKFEVYKFYVFEMMEIKIVYKVLKKRYGVMLFKCYRFINYYVEYFWLFDIISDVEEFK